MTKRPTAYCDRCESTVYADDVHSCYDAKLVRSVAEAERRVVEAADEWEAAHSVFLDEQMACGNSVATGKKSGEATIRRMRLASAVRELRRVRGDHA